MLKRNLINKLSELVLLTELPTNTEQDAQSERLLLDRQINIVEKMLSQNVYRNAEKIVQKVYQKAETLYLILIQVRCFRIWRKIYSLKGIAEETEKYHEKYFKYFRFVEYEEDSIGKWDLIQSHLKFTLMPDMRIVEQCNYFAQQVLKYHGAYDSPFIKIIYFKLLIVFYRYKADCHQWAANLEAWDTLIQEYGFIKTNTLWWERNLAWAAYYTQSRQLGKAQECVQDALKSSDYRAFNKYEVQRHYFDLLIKIQNYAEALEVLNEVYQTTQYELLDKFDKATWLIREAYLNLMLKLLGIDLQTPNFQKKNSLSDFLSQTQILSKDKQGYNSLFMIIRFLMIGLEGSENIEDLGNNLMVYYQRYLKYSSPRTCAFVKNIAHLAKLAFKNKAVQERNEKFWEAIQEHKNYYDEVELVPYELLWDLVLERFSEKEILSYS